MLDVMYDVPNNDEIGEIVVTEGTIKSGEPALTVLRNKAMAG
jgi:ATP-dependent protease Clp ATPase subunit